MARDAWDDDELDVLSARLIEQARQAGALRVLPAALLEGAAVRLAAGELGDGRLDGHRRPRPSQRATGNPVGTLRSADARRLGRAGRRSPQLIADATPEMAARGEGHWLTVAAWATAVLCNGLGRYDQALAAAEQASEDPCELGLATWSLAELIEAAARTGSPERAAGALRQLSEATSAAATDWALGLQARSRALVSRRRARRAAVPRGDRAAWPDPDPGRAGPRVPALRRVAAPPEPPRGRARAAPRSLTRC